MKTKLAVYGLRRSKRLIRKKLILDSIRGQLQFMYFIKYITLSVSHRSLIEC